MVTTDTVAGIIDGAMWLHYDVANDVPYSKLIQHQQAPAVGEETPEGIVLLRREDDDQLIGMTVVNWWKRFGDGGFPDSLRSRPLH